MSTAGYLVEGLTCGKCLAKVLEKVRLLAGVTNVAMDLNTRGQSTLLVLSGTKLGAPVLREAVESVGFGLLPPRGRVVPTRGGPSGERGATTAATDWRVRTAIGHDIPVFAATEQAGAGMRAAQVPLAGRLEAARVGRRPDRALRTTLEDLARPKTFSHTRQRQER